MKLSRLATIVALATATSTVAPTSGSAFAPPSKRGAAKSSRLSSQSKAKRARVSRRSSTKPPKLQRSARAKLASKVRADARAKGTAALTSALLDYADGKRGSSRRKAIARALDAVPGGKETAKRIAARIRAQPGAVIRRHTGAGRSSLSKRKATLGSTVASVRERGYLSSDSPLLTSAITLPAENGSALPSKISFELTGVHCETTEDADGHDELVVLTKSAAVPATSKFTAFQEEVSLPGTLQVSAGKAAATSQAFELSGDDGHVIVSAVAEADGDATAKRQELEVAIALARALAIDMNDTTDPAGALILAVEYAQSMLAMSSPKTAPSLQARRLGPGALLATWSASPSTTGGVEWKAAIEHELGSGGAYTVLFNVPSSPVGEAAVVHVIVSKVSTPFQVGFGHLELNVAIRDESAMQELSVMLESRNPLTHVRRRVLPGMVRVKISVEAHPNDGNFGTPGYLNLDKVGQAEDPQSLDVAPGVRSVLFLDYDPQTDTLYHRGDAVTGANAGGFVTFEGSGNKRGKVKLKVFRTKP